ncbi:hypothetical protein ACN2W4_20975 [Serratia marcescens]|uniref:hypothetical protein n=1 Tax=Serratia marcescens TaxID=615 RepID=UPI0025AAB266|nr:hypothetical protein [Serratia marcescens]MDN0030772.1 hypothetical protein [Serratia marcescens]
MTPDETNDYLKSLKLVPDAEASVEEKQIYSVKKAVIGLIEFVTTSLEEIGIDGLHDLVNPSLDDLDSALVQLDAKADAINELNLKQIILFAQVLIKNIREKNPDLCSEGSRLLKSATDGL